MTNYKNVRRVGRFIENKTGRVVNMHKKTKVGYGVDVIFYYRNGQHVMISDLELLREWSRYE